MVKKFILFFSASKLRIENVIMFSTQMKIDFCVEISECVQLSKGTTITHYYYYLQSLKQQKIYSPIFSFIFFVSFYFIPKEHFVLLGMIWVGVLSAKILSARKKGQKVNLHIIKW